MTVGVALGRQTALAVNNVGNSDTKIDVETRNVARSVDGGSNVDGTMLCANNTKKLD